MHDATPTPSHRSHPNWAALGLLLCLGGLLVGLGIVSFSSRRTEPKPAADPFPLTPISDSPHLNTRPEVAYVGSESCRSCHEDRHASFRQTGMGRSMALVDLSREPSDATFDHVPSKRRYQVVRKDGQLWHRELLLNRDREEILLAEYPLKFAIGSGRHSLTYAVEAEGFLVESPVTWYRSRKAWGMSPGYDHAQQGGFDRAIGEGCLNCHAGRADALDESLHRMSVTEHAISCERCHGPGALHVEKHAGRKATPGKLTSEVDYSIVNPARLSRELAESICQQCHLRTNSTILGRGRAIADFRPGLPLQDFRQDYWLTSGDHSMTVTGHVEQMHNSRCYQKSKSLTCLSCHSPHSEPPEVKQVAHYRAVCLSCHAEQSCKVEPGARRKERADDSCVACHMPTAPTEIPHLAFTHHRIGVHKKGEAKSKSGGERGSLSPFLSLTRLSDLDQRRSLGLGYLELANREHDADRVESHRRESLRLLLEVRGEGLRDAAVESSLARLCFDLQEGGVGSFAESALGLKGLVGQDRCNALFLLADEQARAGRHAEAKETLQKLTRLRRHSEDWFALARAENALGNITAEEEALRMVVRIDPRSWRTHQYLAERYRKQGNEERATWHQKRAVR